MGMIFSFFIFFLTIYFIISLVKPNLLFISKEKTRKNVLLFIGIPLIISFIINSLFFAKWELGFERAQREFDKSNYAEVISILNDIPEGEEVYDKSIELLSKAKVELKKQQEREEAAKQAAAAEEAAKQAAAAAEEAAKQAAAAAAKATHRDVVSGSQSISNGVLKAYMYTNFTWNAEGCAKDVMEVAHTLLKKNPNVHRLELEYGIKYTDKYGDKKEKHIGKFVPDDVDLVRRYKDYFMYQMGEDIEKVFIALEFHNKGFK